MNMEPGVAGEDGQEDGGADVGDDKQKGKMYMVRDDLWWMLVWKKKGET